MMPNRYNERQPQTIFYFLFENEDVERLPRSLDISHQVLHCLYFS